MHHVEDQFDAQVVDVFWRLIAEAPKYPDPRFVERLAGVDPKGNEYLTRLRQELLTHEGEEIIRTPEALTGGIKTPIGSTRRARSESPVRKRWSSTRTRRWPI